MQIITDQSQKEIKEHGNFEFPVLISSEKLSKYESGSFLWHWHPEIELTLIKKGQMIYKVNDHVFHLHQGMALLNNTGSLHSGCMFENQDCEYVSVTFDPKLIYGYENSLIYSKYVSPITKDLALPAIYFDLSESWHQDITDLLRAIIEVGQKHPSCYELDILINLEKMWKLLILNYDSPASISSYDKRNYERIRSILSYIEANYTNKLTLEEIAEHIHLCKSECCRLFKQYMKIPLFEFILAYRIEKSLSYLHNSNYSISAIAANVGFNDSNYYSKVFSKIKGCPPTRYRKAL